MYTIGGEIDIISSFTYFEKKILFTVCFSEIEYLFCLNETAI